MKKIRISLGVCTFVLAFMLTTLTVPLMAQDWPMFGQNVANTAYTTPKISASTVPTLLPKWTFTTGGDVSARASVVNSIAYFPDWGGNLWAVNAVNGQLIWGHQLSDYGLPAGTTSRTSPALNDNGSTLYLGTQATPQGAWLLAINAKTGALVWKTVLDSDKYAIDTTSPVIYNGVVYTGVASAIEGATFSGATIASDPNARGSVVAINATTGAIQWKTYTVPMGYWGGGVWGSNPVVDAARNTVFVGTGNNYIAPSDPAFVNCVNAGGSREACQSPANHTDSILALNMSTGAVKWSTRLETWNQSSPPYPYPFADGSDFWNVDCSIPAAYLPPQYSQCPANPGPDYDFGSAPNEITYTGSDGKAHAIIGAGQKSGIYYALDPDTGTTLWQTQVGPGSSLGGMEWGSASDGKRIYVQISNLNGISYAAGSAGSWSALDPATGSILWQRADPNGSIALGPVTVGNGVVYGESMSSTAGANTMLAMDAATGNVLWGFAPGSSVVAGATLVQNTVYWGSGYAHLPLPGFTGNNKFYAFTPNGK
jgi:polyvinyl alcohol dehydrogenase (cytochrome)